MKHQAAYSLLYLAGNASPTKDQVEKFMKATGVSVDKEALDAFFKVIEGKSIPELAAAGKKKHVSMPCGGGAAVATGAGAAAAQAAPEEEKKEEEEDVDMGGLFGGDEDDY
mmetsp:Transcript_5063/g.7642  ORF Transcript_5063/g.7642 Transcript_5063/m.7642 type:complete len:111 (-) Transcript_5063:177-509(-)|eukprot:CAMPEP_0170479290 /NCGR_PEP_ID=MMETSP0208-20121228/581_1 /TAXON_ID=197538 /ORGANISM="Strombidium inclinatum, Strain S3" /LENGTH=110 /DNA_ID=CAMNT_0010751655 /DNA_START=76 /DNA_END=408 /DNA_ORIENTATION=+